MTVQTDLAIATYAGNGVTVSFPIPFRFLQNSHLLLSLVSDAPGSIPVPLVITTDYSITGARNPNGGAALLAVAPPAGFTLIIQRDMPFTQLTDYRANDPFPEESAEDIADERTMEGQQIKEVLGRSLKLPAQLSGYSGDLPAPSPLKPLVWNAGGTGLENGDTLGTGDMLLRPDLVSSAAGKGAALVAFKQSGTGAIHRTMMEKARERVSVKDWGAVGDGVTDDAAAIQEAINNAVEGSEIVLPPGRYRVSATIQVEPNRTLTGLSDGDGIIGMSGAEIIGDLAVTPVVRVTGGVAAEPSSLRRVVISRAAGAIPASSIGLRIQSTDQPVIEDVVIRRHAIGLDIGGQLGLQFNRVNTYTITESHVRIQDSFEVAFQDCRFGRNGGFDVACLEYVQITGANVDTVSFIRCQFNQNGGEAFRGIYLNAYTNANGIIKFIGCHAETMTGSFIFSTGACVLNRLSIESCTLNLNAPTIEFLAIPAASMNEFTMIGCSSINAALTLDQHNKWRVIGNSINGPITLNAGGGVFAGNTINSTLGMLGAMSATAVYGNSLQTASAITNIATGNVEVFGNVTSNAANNNALVNSFAGRYAKFGENLPYSVKRLTGVSDGAGIYSPAHGINIGNNVILAAMAYYKGGGGIMLPMNFVYIDAVNVQFNGATATTPARITLIYTDDANSHAW